MSVSEEKDGDDSMEIITRYLQTAREKAAKWCLPGGSNWKNSKPVKVTNVGVIGGGTMGRAIAIAFSRAGYHTVLVENNEQSMRMCREQLETVYAREEKLGRFTAALTEKIRGKIHLTVDLSSLRECELVVEAVFEKMQLKMELFSKLDEICPAGTIFATNTSSLDINKMASVLKNPSRLVGIHFFNPAHVIRTVEIVYGRHTSAESVATAFSVSSAMKKVAVLVGNCPSFVFNRLLGVYLNQAEKLLYQYGMLPKDVDALITAFGFPIGPFTMADLNGLDVLAFLKSEHNYPLTALEKELLSRNRLGRKTGRGFYVYDAKTQAKVYDREIEDIVERLSTNANHNIRLYCDADVLEFLLYPMVNEGFLCLEEGMIEDEMLIDILFVLGFGWPLRAAGLMRWARSVGLENIAERVAYWSKLEPDDRSYNLSRTLELTLKKKSQL